MSAKLIDGKAIAQQVRAEVREEVAAWVTAGNPRPGLATVLVGDDPASAVYVGGKQKACAEVGIEGFNHQLPADTSQDEVEQLLAELGADDRVSGILLQLPTPDQIDGPHLTRADRPAQGRRRPHPGLRRTAGQGPPGPAAVHARRRDRAAAPPRRRRWSAPRRWWSAARTWSASRLRALLLAEQLDGHDLPLAHARPGRGVRRADVLIAAVGRARMIQGDWVKPGATVIDVGINRTDDGLVGDVDFEPAAEVAGLITPVPGGVGPMTIAMLLRNTLEAAKLQVGQRAPA